MQFNELEYKKCNKNTLLVLLYKYYSTLKHFSKPTKN